MCDVIANQTEKDYECRTRTIRINGHSTSVRLENYYWRILGEIAEAEGFRSVPMLLGKLNEEIIELRGEMVNNFASLLRVGCVKYMASGRTGALSLFTRHEAAV